MKDKKRPLPPPPASNPFAALAGLKTHAASAEPETTSPNVSPAGSPRAARGRVDVLRNTAHRGGKTVTVLKGFTGVDDTELQALARKLQKRCGTGGTVKAGAIEIQGDHRETVMTMLAEAGFRPVRAGG